MSATHLARHLSEVLDAIEHRGESFTIERHGKVVARIEAAGKPSGRGLREHFESKTPDPELADAIEEGRRWINTLPARLEDPWRD